MFLNFFQFIKAFYFFVLWIAHKHTHSLLKQELNRIIINSTVINLPCFINVYQIGIGDVYVLLRLVVFITYVHMKTYVRYNYTAAIFYWKCFVNNRVRVIAIDSKYTVCERKNIKKKQKKNRTKNKRTQ